jgi:cytochrome P450
MYPEPDRFNPDRFLDKEGKLNPSVRDPTEVVFGYGRRSSIYLCSFILSSHFPCRICPGRHIGYSSLWLAMTAILTTMDLSNWIDPKTGEVDVPTGEYSYGLAL